jgi:AcrR family transcriptional regulator
MPVDRDQAVFVALRLLDDDGLDKLTVRRIAAELGVQAPALYWHFSSKRTLLDYLTDAMVAAEIDAVPEPDGRDWADWLGELAGALRRGLLAHRDGARVASGAGLGGAAGLGRFLERTTAVLHGAGLPLPEALRAAGALMSFVIGRTVEEQSLPDEEDASRRVAPLYPTIAAAMTQSLAAGKTQDDAFAFSLGIMLAGLRATISSRRRPARRSVRR